MQVSFTGSLQAGRAAKTIGRIKVVGRWRGADEPATEADRRALLRDLTREAEDYGADALIDVRFDAEETAEMRRRQPAPPGRQRFGGADHARRLNDRPARRPQAGRRAANPISV